MITRLPVEQKEGVVVGNGVEAGQDLVLRERLGLVHGDQLLARLLLGTHITLDLVPGALACAQQPTTQMDCMR